MLQPIPEYLPAHFAPRRQKIIREESHPFLYDDFVGDALDRKWARIQGSGGLVDFVSGQAGGVIQLSTDTDSNSQTAALYTGNLYSLDLRKGLIFEFRARFRGASAGNLISSNHEIVAGVAGAYSATSDNVARAAWFRWEAAENTLLETDDTTNNIDDIDSGHDLSGATDLDDRWSIYTIDFTKMENVAFFIDGKRKRGQNSTTFVVEPFDMSNLTDTEALMQPFFKIRKITGTGQVTFELDYVKAWHSRGS